MIFVTQGHEHSIGLEVFIKSFLLINYHAQKDFLLFCTKNSLKKTLQSLNIKFSLADNYTLLSNTKLNCNFVENDVMSETLSTLEKALEVISEKDILLTLPSSKEQFFYQNKHNRGYTEFLRNKFNSKNLAMGFYYKNTLFNLITDHIPLNKVSESITQKKIISKTINTITGFNKYFKKIDEIYFSGINPHAGENGLLGNEEERIKESIIHLQAAYPQIKISGPYSGDVIIKKRDQSKVQIFTFFHHDQGLGIFKAINQYFGINITFGLPFLRMSVDHGTAFDLYKKNKANYLGCLYMLKTASKIHLNI